jgi:hypothetical protein
MDQQKPVITEVRVTVHKNLGNYSWEEIGLTIDLNGSDLDKTIKLAKKRIQDNFSVENKEI